MCFFFTFLPKPITAHIIGVVQRSCKTLGLRHIVSFGVPVQFQKMIRSYHSTILTIWLMTYLHMHLNVGLSPSDPEDKKPKNKRSRRLRSSPK